MSASNKRVVIVGGGFGGLEAAKALDGAPVDVTLVDRANYYLFQPLLYQVAMAGLSPAEIASPIRGILANQKNVRVMLGDVTGIDLANKSVVLDGGAETLAFDWLVVAVGAKTAYFGHDEWERHAPGLKSIEDALEIRRRVLVAFEKAERERDARERRRLLTFCVIGGGPTGVELAGAIAELSHHVLGSDFRSVDPKETSVVLVEAGARILPSFPEDLAQAAVEQLADLGVEVRTDSRVVTIDERGVELLGDDDADELPGLGAGREKNRIPAATVLWGAGVRANALTAGLGVPLDRQGRVVVKSDCSIDGHPSVFVIGDCAHFEEDGQVLPGVSPVAMQQARYVAKIVKRETRAMRSGHDTPEARRPFRYFDKGSMATIGRSRAIAWARGIKMRGFVAWMAWLFIHLLYLIGFKNRLVVLLTWAWSYVSYKRGARLITSTGWSPHGAPQPAPVSRSTGNATAPALPEVARARPAGPSSARAASPTS